jgi:sec-independent protein translocase protein TatC
MDEELTIKEHFIKLRNILFRVGGLTLIFFIPLFYFSNEIIGFIISFFKVAPYVLYPAEYFNAQLKLTIYLALTIVLPYLFLEMIIYLKPLFPKENSKNILALYIYAIDLALIGAFIGLFVFGSFTLSFLSNVPTEITLAWSLENVLSYLGFCTWSFALITQLVIIIPLLNYYGIIPREVFIKSRRYVFMFILIFAAIITPTTDAVSLLSMSLPMYGLFECGLLVSKVKIQENTKI